LARDRKRAKQRRQRQAQPSAAPTRRRVDAEPGEPRALDQAAGVDADPPVAFEPDADTPDALAAEALGSPDEQFADADAEAFVGAGLGADAEEFADADAELDADAGAAPARARRRAATPALATEQRVAPRGPGRFLAFLRASWTELQRVQWPDRRQVTQATGVVLGFVVVAGAFLGLADFVASKLVNAII